MYLRRALAFLAFALSWLTVVPAPNAVLWLVAVAVTEWGVWLALVTGLVLAWELRRGRWRLVTAFLCLGAIAFLSVPIGEATFIARDLPGALEKAYGPVPATVAMPSAPFSLTKLVWSRRAAGVNEQTLHYTTQDGRPLALDFFADATPGNLPCIVVVHGGAWCTGNEKELQAWNPILARRGYRVASIAYRLAPRFRWPAQKQDLLAAIAYLKANASRLGIDPDRFVLLGRSAGAQIVLATAYAVHDPAIRGVIACYPPTDMEFDYGPAASHSILNAHKLISQFLGGTPAEVPENYRDASALQLVGPDSPPTLLAHGTRDELVWIENSRKLRDRLIEAHRPVYLLELPWATHGFDANPSGPGGQLALYAISWFLGSILPAAPR